MREILRDFVSEENRNYRFMLGHVVASSLTGFVAGIIVASIVWMIALSHLAA